MIDNNSIIESKLIKLFQIIFKIKDEKKIKNIEVNSFPEWDSITHIKMILNIENEFDIEIPEEDIEILYDFENIKNYILSLDIK